MLSSRARYGLKALAYLGARFSSGELTAVDEIARDEDLPEKFLEATLTQLRKRGILFSRRGPAGGYRLARSPDKITVAEVIRTLDGPFAPTPCARTREPAQCEGCDDISTCMIRPIMREVRNAMARILERRTVSDLIEFRMGRTPIFDVPMYYI